MEDSFSKRFGYRRPMAEITIREGAPEKLRMAIIQIAIDLGLKPSQIRETLCKVLLKAPDRNNWSEYPNVWDEVKDLIESAPWFKVYDISEELVKTLGPATSKQYYGTEPQLKFEKELNEVFGELGIGWQMVNGKIETRGTEVFEDSVQKAKTVLVKSGRTRAESELREAIADLSRRPEPDLTGAVQHSMAALECVARDVCGQPSRTLGDLLQKEAQKLGIPKPLNEAVEKAWGYASEMGRHVQEGRFLERVDVEFIVGICATVSTYLCQKVPTTKGDPWL
ncbi:MAG: hypothetical protein HXY44_18695 [Syntrophaceae bacterium]|nr:hypothetical protein [Syntrophaceae bacterium]